MSANKRFAAIFALGGLLVAGGSIWTTAFAGGWGGVVCVVVGCAIWGTLPGPIPSKEPKR